jgi:hypothetical protein
MKHEAAWTGGIVVEELPQKGLVRFSHLSSRPKFWARVVNWVPLGSMHASILLKDQDGLFPRDSQYLFWLLLDSRVVNLPRSSNLIVVTLSSLKPLFFNGLKKAVHFSDDVGA